MTQPDMKPTDLVDLAALWRQVNADHPGADADQLRELFVTAVMADQQLQRAVSDFFVDNELRGTLSRHN